jgi:hypothetical protein
MTATLTAHGEQLLETARARGLGRSPEEIVERALEAVVKPDPPVVEEEKDRRQAVAAMLEFSKKHHLTLAPGVRIKDLIQEGRKY